jgi:aminoglycoside phosphotransferase (APT) family kinase protein
MIKTNIVDVLSDRINCARCHVSNRWIPLRRPEVRQYSSIHRLRCANCEEEIVAKVVGGRFSSRAALVHARKEYEALCALQSAFPQDAQFGTLVPLGHFEYEGRGIVVTRLAPGHDLMRYVRRLDARQTQAVFHSAGAWLKKLHASDLQDRNTQLGVADKISTLHDRYRAVLQGDPKTLAACDLFDREACRVDAIAVAAVRQHGDFKPGNILFDGTRYIGLDIHWGCVGAAVYDLAPFLNHLWFDFGPMTSSHRSRLHVVSEAAFLSGYGGAIDMRALRWAQLYFALCYMGGYRKRGPLAAIYAKWKIWPLIRKLMTQFEKED